MNIQKKLYAATERKLVVWCIAAMLFMSISVIVPAYLVTTNWLEHSAANMEASHRQLLWTLVTVQGVVVVVGAGLSFVFARKALHPIRRAHQAQADFAANAHHQLRTPITVMQAEVDTALLRKSQTPENYRRVFKSIGQELHLLRVTSENLLSLADSAISGKSGIKPSTSEDFADIIDSLQRRYHIPIAVTASRSSLPLSQEELGIILETLLENTIKHAGIGRKALTVSVALKSNKNKTVLEYSDNGRGVTKGEERHLFDRTFRGSRAVKGDVPGGGLGLAIVAEIARMRGGRAKAGNVSANGGFHLTIQFLKSTKR